MRGAMICAAANQPDPGSYCTPNSLMVTDRPANCPQPLLQLVQPLIGSSPHLGAASQLPMAHTQPALPPTNQAGWIPTLHEFVH